jgi:AcrR family transcriptional regulator
MVRDQIQIDFPAVGDHPRRDGVLDSALGTFARYGYRKTSMEEVARAAHISRPGLYFLFSSKEVLFHAAVERTLQHDIDAVANALQDTDQSLQDRLLTSFDHWAGRYVGPLASEVIVVIDDNPNLLGDLTETMPQRFEELIIEAIATTYSSDTARQISQTLISASIGVKHQVGERADYRDRMAVTIALVVH